MKRVTRTLWSGIKIIWKGTVKVTRKISKAIRHKLRKKIKK